jgi:hypothetical protein
MLINIKGYAKLAKHHLEEHMEYDGMNKDEVNPNGKHLWMQSMSMLKRENNMVKSKALKHMTAYEQCMKAKAMLPPHPLALNRGRQKGQGMESCKQKDYTMNV